METTKTAVKEDYLQLLSITIFQKITEISNSDIAMARKELSRKDSKFPGEIFIGKMNELEIKTLTFIIKAKKDLETEINLGGDVSKQRVITGKKRANRLSMDIRDISFAKILLKYFVKNRFILPPEMELDFRKDFQIISKPLAEYRFGEEFE